jgi:toxin secretion/phage lysis holin
MGLFELAKEWLTIHPFVVTLIFLVLLDIATGLLAAWVRKEISSKVSLRGMVKKVSLFFAIALASILDPYDGGIPLLDLTAFCFIVTESISNAENLANAGVYIPPPLRRALAALKDKQEEEEKKTPTINFSHTEGNEDGNTRRSDKD